MSNYQHPIGTELTGYVALSDTPSGSNQLSVGMYAGRDPDSIRLHSPDAVVTNVKRARYVAREFHDWNLPTDDDILTQHRTA